MGVKPSDKELDKYAFDFVAKELGSGTGFSVESLKKGENSPDECIVSFSATTTAQGIEQYANAGELNAFGPGDYGPSGEDVRDRFVLAGTVHLPGGIELSTINQVESARPITITNADNTGRIWILFNGASQPTYTGLDIFRGTPYIQSDLRVTRPIKIGERWEINPFAEFFNIFNRNNPGANYAVNVVQLAGARAPDGARSIRSDHRQQYLHECSLHADGASPA